MPNAKKGENKEKTEQRIVTVKHVRKPGTPGFHTILAATGGELIDTNEQKTKPSVVKKATIISSTRGNCPLGKVQEEKTEKRQTALQQVSLEEILDALRNTRAGGADFFDEYITRDMLHANEKTKDISDSDLILFFGYYPEVLSKDMAVYIAAYSVLKESNSKTTFSKAKKLVKAVQEDEAIESEIIRSEALMYHNLIRISAQGVIDSFEWRKRNENIGKENANNIVHGDHKEEAENKEEEFRQTLIENMESKGTKVYGKRGDDYKMISVAVQTPLFKMVQIARACYKGNLTKYMSRLIIDDAKVHGYTYYDILKTYLSEMEYYSYMQKWDIDDAKSIIDLVIAHEGY